LNAFFKTSPGSYFLLAFPALASSLELLRAWIFTGFPWLEVGTLQVFGPFSNFAPLIGGPGCSLLSYFFGGFLGYVLYSRKLGLLWKNLGLLLLSFLSFMGLGFILNHPSYTQTMGPSISVSLVQGNIPQSLKWDPNNLLLSLNHYDQALAHTKSELMLWPESAIPLFQTEAGAYLDSLNHYADNHSIALISGIPLMSLKSSRYFNGALGLGRASGSYKKVHLVPFGETIPLKSLVGSIFEFLQVPLSDFSAGNSEQALIQAKIHSQKIPIAVFICYETAYADYVRKIAKQSELLAALSDDAWFGHSEGPYQHLQINQMRALENQRFLLNATNNGITAIISPQGKILSRLPAFKNSSLNAFVFARKGETPWERWGEFPEILSLLLMFIFSRITQIKHLINKKF